MVEAVGGKKRYPVKAYVEQSMAAAFPPDDFEAILSDIKAERERKIGISFVEFDSKEFEKNWTGISPEDR